MTAKLDGRTYCWGEGGGKVWVWEEFGSYSDHTCQQSCHPLVGLASCQQSQAFQTSRPPCVSLPFIRPLSRLSNIGNIQYVTCGVYCNSFPPLRMAKAFQSPLMHVTDNATHCNMLINKVPLPGHPITQHFPPHCLLLPALPFASQLSDEAKLIPWIRFFLTQSFHFGLPLKSFSCHLFFWLNSSFFHVLSFSWIRKERKENVNKQKNETA